jgi:hypothetical protein
MLLAATAAAGVSWWFRYSATHQTARFWGPDAARLIRDAPRVILRTYDPAVVAEGESADSLPRNISAARGLVHMRNALLEDSSYDWSVTGGVDSNCQSSLTFEVTAGAEPRVVILFSPDFNWAANGSADAKPRPTVSCRPIAEGLKTFFADALANSPTER